MNHEDQYVTLSDLVKVCDRMENKSKSGIRYQLSVRGLRHLIEIIPKTTIVRCNKCAKRGDPMECPMCYYYSRTGIMDMSVPDGYCDRGVRKLDDR